MVELISTRASHRRRGGGDEGGIYLKYRVSFFDMNDFPRAGRPHMKTTTFFSVLMRWLIMSAVTD
jgi:hypothetical protein